MSENVFPFNWCLIDGKLKIPGLHLCTYAENDELHYIGYFANHPKLTCNLLAFDTLGRWNAVPYLMSLLAISFLFIQ